MTGQQQFAAAADMLTGARNKDQSGSGLPPDSLIRAFQADVAQVCSVPATADSLKLAEVGATGYLTGRSTYEP